MSDEPVRSANGELPEWQSGRCFSSNQCEWLALSNVDQRHGGVRWQIGLIQLQGGKWMNDLFIWSDRFATREAALRKAVADRIREARALFRITKPLEKIYKINVDEYQAVVSWSLSLLGKPARQVYVNEEIDNLADMHIRPGQQLGLGWR